MKFSDLSGGMRIVGGMFVGVTLYANFGPQPEPQYRDVIVPTEVIRTVERVDTVVTWKERIVYRTPVAEQVATATGGGQGDVDRFCAESVAADTAGSLPDSSTLSPRPSLLLRSARLQTGWFFQRDKLILTGPLSNGDLQQRTYSTRGSFQAVTHQDSVIVQYPRTALLKEAGEAGAWVGLGVVACLIFCD